MLPHAEALRVVLVERDRRVAGEVFMRKGHIERDWCSRASMMMILIGHFRVHFDDYLISSSLTKMRKIMSDEYSLLYICLSRPAVSSARGGGFHRQMHIVLLQ